MKKHLIVLTFLFMLLVQLACGASSDLDAVGTAVEQTMESLATQPVVEVDEAGPTETALEESQPPTNTPKPTNTPLPTNTPQPTSTPTPPPEPISFSGNGDDVLDLEGVWGGAGFVHVISIGMSNFIVYSYDQYGNENELVVNEIAPFEGYYPFGFNIRGDVEDTARLEVDAEGAWDINIYPLAEEYIPVTANVPTTIYGDNDTLILVLGEPDLLIVKSTGDSIFTIYGYGDDWKADLVVNEIAPFEGKYIIHQGIFLLVVDAEGSWEIEFTAK